MRERFVGCWLLFTFLFLFLAVFHFIETSKEIPLFVHSPIQPNKIDCVFVNEWTGVDLDKPLRSFTVKFNKYLENYNQAARNQNLLAGLGYLLGGVVSAISLLISTGTLSEYDSREV